MRPAWQHGAVELLAAYRSGALTPLQAVADCIARRQATDGRLNAFVALRDEAALQEAQASTARWQSGRPLGPLDGLPLAVKDNLPTHDLPTTWGSMAGRGHRTAHDELAVARARSAGAIVMGKTNVPEFTLEGYTANALHGVTRNPWNTALTPGGSSGGSVAAVAAGMAPLALGTDGGGSTRRPASHTGLVGFKPSLGAIPRLHALPPLLLDFEVVGAIARSVADARLLFDVLRGPDAADLASQAAAGQAAPLQPVPGQPLQVLYVPTLGGAPVDPQVAASCRQAAAQLAAMGHVVEEGPLPLDLAEIDAGWPQVGQIGLAWLMAQHPHWRAGASARYLAMAEAGAGLAATALWQLLEATARLRREAAALFARHALVVMPSAAALPWPAEEAFPTRIDGQPVGPRGHAVFTGWVNAAGLPAVSVPCAPSAEGLPIGVQLIAGHGRDTGLLDLAAALEARGPAWRWPAGLPA